MSVGVVLTGTSHAVIGFGANFVSSVAMSIPFEGLRRIVLGNKRGEPELAMSLGAGISTVLLVHSGLILKTLAAKVGAIFYLHTLSYWVGRQIGEPRALAPYPEIRRLAIVSAVIAGVALAILTPIFGLSVGIITCLHIGLVTTFCLGFRGTPYVIEIWSSIGPSQFFGAFGFLLSLARFIFQGMKCSYYCWRSASKATQHQKDIYMSPCTTYTTQNDLRFLKYRLSFVESRDAAKENARLMKIYLKAIVPIVGLAWVVRTETRLRETILPPEMFTIRPAHDNPDTSEQRMLAVHINMLETKLQRRATISPIFNDYPATVIDVINAYHYGLERITPIRDAATGKFVIEREPVRVPARIPGGAAPDREDEKKA